MSMRVKVLSGLGVVVLAFMGYVATRPSHFNYERSRVIAATPEKIFPYLRDFRLGAQWNPYDQKDPQMKRTFSGAAAGPGMIMDFEGNSDVGSGRLEVVREVPGSLVELRLAMTKPMEVSNTVIYRLSPEANGTRMTWSMTGENGFLGKLMTVLIDCDKMMAGDFETGLTNLERVVTTAK